MRNARFLHVVVSVALVSTLQFGLFVQQTEAQKPKEEQCLMQLRDGVIACFPRLVTEQDLLAYYAKKAVEEGLPHDQRVYYLRTYLDLLINFDSDQARRNMPMTYSVIDSKTPKFFTLSGNWQWVDGEGGELVHTSSDGNAHTATGIGQYVIPSSAVLSQRVYLDPENPPTQIAVGFKVPLAGYAGIFNIVPVCRAIWGGEPIRYVRPDHTRFDCYAGPLPEKGKWVTLEVPTIDFRLGGMRPLIFEVTFEAVGGKALWGETVIRRSEVELYTSKGLGIYHFGESLDLVARINNFTKEAQPYHLASEVYDLDGNRVCSAAAEVNIPASTTKEVHLNVDGIAYPGKNLQKPFKSYFIAYATLTRPGATAKARTSFGFILPNRTGPMLDSPFGAMIWDTPASQEGAALYRDAGVKIISLANSGRMRGGEGPLLSLYRDNDMYIQPHIWSNPFQNSAEAARAHKAAGKPNPLIPSLSNTIREWGPRGAALVSNMWEVELHFRPDFYGITSEYFYEAVKQGNPNALVGTGGMVGPTVTYLDAVLKNGGRGHLDFMTFMGYLFSDPPERSDFFDDIKAIREVFEKHGMPEAKVWIGEWNYFDKLNIDFESHHRVHQGISRDVLSEYIIRESLICLAAGAKWIMPNSLFQTSWRPLRHVYGHDYPMSGCASHRYDHTPLPMYFAWSVMARNIEGKVFKGMIDCGPGVYCLRFDVVKDSYKKLDSSPCVIVLWSEHGARPVSLQVGQKSVEVVNFVGDVRKLQTLDGIVTVSATPKPQYLLLDSRTSASVRYVREPVIEPVDSKCEVTCGEEGEVAVAFRVTNPTGKALRGRVVFEGPNWCTSEPGEMEVNVDAKKSGVARFKIKVPKENGERVHYEFADLVSRAQHFITVCLLDEKGNRIGVSRVPLFVREPLEVRLRPLCEGKGEPKFVVHICNRSSTARKGSIEIRTRTHLKIVPGSKDFSVDAGAEIAVPFDVGGLGPMFPPVGYALEAIVKCDDGSVTRQLAAFTFYRCVRAPKPPVIDGNDNDWADAAWMWGKRWATMWDEKNFYLFFRAQDAVFYQPYTAEMLWNGDMIRFVLDPTPDLTDGGIQPAPRDPGSSHTFDVGLSPKGPQLYRRHYACGRPRGLVNSAKMSIVKSKDGLAYELAIPWGELGAASPKTGGWMHMSIGAGNNDGHGRSGVNVPSEPRLMGDINFVE